MSERQLPMSFPLGGGTFSKPGESSGEGGKLKADLGRATVVDLPKAEVERRWKPPLRNGQS